MATDKDLLAAYHSTYDDPSNAGWNSGHVEQTAQQDLASNSQRFTSLFNNFVGRAPTSDELQQFKDGFLSQSGNNIASVRLDPQSWRNNVTQFISDNFQQAAKDQTTQNLQNQQGQATQLSDLFRTQGQQAISSTESMLKDYQQSLFDKLRPQLLTSLQSQGLLNTGGLNDALAGAQKDLASSAQGYLADANMNLQNQANSIAFGGASAPYLFQQGQYMNQVPYLQSQGQGALDFGNQNFMNQQNFWDQMALQNNQGRIQAGLMNPGFGSSFSNSFGSGLGSGLGGNLTKWTSPQGVATAASLLG